MADRSNSFPPPKPIVDQHDAPANGAGGTPGTHEGHADAVPSVALGLGYGQPTPPQTKGNSAGRQGAAEAMESGSPYSVGTGNQGPPSAQ